LRGRRGGWPSRRRRSRLGGEFKLLVEDDIGGFLALADLSAGLGHCCTCPGAGAVTGFLGIGPERHDVDAAIGFLGRDVDGSHDVAGRAMPGQAKLSCALLDRADDLVGDVLVNIEASLVMAVPLCLRAARLRPRGAKGPGPLRRGIKRRALRRAAKRDGAAQADL